MPQPQSCSRANCTSTASLCAHSNILEGREYVCASPGIMDTNLPVKMMETWLVHFSGAGGTLQQRRHLSFALRGHHPELPVWQVGLYRTSRHGTLLKGRPRTPVTRKWPLLFHWNWSNSKYVHEYYKV